MKKILSEYFLIIMLFLLPVTASIYTGCKKGSCDNVVCLNGGHCTGGRCSCTVGFEGDECEIKQTDRYVGSYIARDKCESGIIPDYNVQISASGTFPDKILIRNFGEVHCNGTPITVEATVKGNSFVIEPHSLCSHSYTISGSGTFNQTERIMHIDYDIYFNHPDYGEVCQGDYFKQ